MNKFYGAHDQWTDLDKQNDVLITSTDGVIDSVKVNGEDYGGGGGSSDFSTADLTLVNNTSDKYNTVLVGSFIIYSEELSTMAGFGDPDNETTVETVFYKNMPAYATININSGIIATCTGDVRIISSSAMGAYTFEITGSGSITIEDNK